MPAYTREQMSMLIAESESDSPLVLLAQRLEVDQFLIVMDTLGYGHAVYIPGVEDFFDALYREQRNSQIVARHNGANTNQLAIEYKLDASTIRRIVAGAKLKEKR